MLKRLFQKTPTVEQFRQIVFQSLKANDIQMPNDTLLEKEMIDGFEYSQIWKSQAYHMMFVARCKDIRNKNCKIQFDRIRLS